jgi:hypothetical protein
MISQYYTKNIGIQVNEVRTENNDEDFLKKIIKKSSNRLLLIQIPSNTFSHIIKLFLTLKYPR